VLNFQLSPNCSFIRGGLHEKTPGMDSPPILPLP
jgi:hypothetical protein